MKHSIPLASPLSSRSRLQSMSHRLTQSGEEKRLDLGLPKIKRLLTIQETADILLVSHTTVRNMIDCGALDAGHVGLYANPQRQHLRITRESVERLQKERFGA